MSNESKLEQPIAQVEAVLNEILTDLYRDESDFTDKIEDAQFSPYKLKLDSFLEKLDIDYSIDKSKLSNEISESLNTDIEKFNSSVSSQLNECIFLTSFQNQFHTILTGHLQALVNPESAQIDSSVGFALYEIPQNQFTNFTKLKLLLDFQIYLYSQDYQFIKSVFYESLFSIAKFLFSITTAEVDKFWFYVESRQEIISGKIFSRSLISDRISMLEICNYLTDKYIEKSPKGEVFPRKKDTFNDVFQFRIRSFITNLLAFDDNTGLNKYFTVHNRYVPDFNKIGNQFLEDILYLQKLFNDPYRYLKKENTRELGVLIDRTVNVYEYLLAEEAAWREKPVDQFAVPKPKSDAEKIYLKEKYANLEYFPESFWVSIANSPISEKDLQYFMSVFAKSKTRNEYLLQIYIIANLYFELTAHNKKDLLQSIGAPSNVKHLTDETLTDSQKGFFYKVKKEVFAGLRTTDNQFAFLIQHLAQSEKIWWSWLIYGKDNNGKSFFADKELTQEDIQEVASQFAAILPYKSTKYFNTYVTPQLSRKMKAERGLDKLNISRSDSDKFTSEIASLTEQINSAPSAELIEKRNTLLWKELRGKRQSQWFSLNKQVTMSVLNGKETPETSEETQPSESSPAAVDSVPTGTKRPISPASDDVEEPEKKRTKA